MKNQTHAAGSFALTHIAVATALSLGVMVSGSAYGLGLGRLAVQSALGETLKAEIDEEAWSTLHSDTSRPFDKPKGGRVAVKVINHLGDEVMKVFKV